MTSQNSEMFDWRPIEHAWSNAQTIKFFLGNAQDRTRHLSCELTTFEPQKCLLIARDLSSLLLILQGRLVLEAGNEFL